jgi:hypothetical protein
VEEKQEVENLVKGQRFEAAERAQTGVKLISCSMGLAPNTITGTLRTENSDLHLHVIVLVNSPAMDGTLDPIFPHTSQISCHPSFQTPPSHHCLFYWPVLVVFMTLLCNVHDKKMSTPHSTPSLLPPPSSFEDLQRTTTVTSYPRGLQRNATFRRHQ